MNSDEQEKAMIRRWGGYALLTMTWVIWSALPVHWPCVYAQNAPSTPGQYLGPGSCFGSNCHASAEPRNLYGVKQNEYFIWSQQDRHTRAYKALRTEKAARIADNLKIKEKPFESAQCLDCHTLHVPRNVQAQDIDFAEGVSCEACHGPAGGWRNEHQQDGWTYEMSVKAGMKDLRNLVSRTETCLACHLGNSQKTVNHELIAAGHPDLIFELDNYSAAMPAHWIPYTDKRKQEGVEDMPAARAWAVGQAVAFREGMLQVARRTKSNDWPEFAEMNCYACHHSLKDGEWRQMRGYKFKAGLPHWNPARYAVLRHLVSAYAPEERQQLDGQVDRLAAAIAKLNTPPTTVAQVATDLSGTIDRVIPRIRRANFDNLAAVRLVDAIAKDVPYLMDAEVHSAEQAIMAINSLVSTLARDKPTITEGSVKRALDQLYQDVEDRERFNRETFARHLSELRSLIE